MTGDPNEFSDVSDTGESTPDPSSSKPDSQAPPSETGGQEPTAAAAESPAPDPPQTPPRAGDSAVGDSAVGDSAAGDAGSGDAGSGDAGSGASGAGEPPAVGAAEMPASAPGASETEASPQEGDRPRIQIGSRREGGPQGALPQMPRPASAPPQAPEAPPRRSGPVKPPSKRDPLPADLEAELAEALGNSSLEDMLASDRSSGDVLEPESRVSATIVKVHGDDVFMSLGGHHEGVASSRQFKEPPEPGAALEVIVRGVNREDGLYEVAVPGAAIDVSNWSDLQEGAVVEVRVTGSNTGGLECKVNNIRGFIPASQISMYRVENLNEYIDQRLSCVVTEANPKRKNLVLSHRAILEREKEAQREEILAGLAPGQIREGVVRSLRDFGAFVDLGGVDGLIHVSQLSWERVNHPQDVLKEGEKVQVRVEKVNSQTGKISLSYRSLQEHPWTGIEEKFSVGAVVDGVVSRIANFGAFVKLAPGIEGLVHVSELAHHRVSLVSAIVREGDEVKVKVLSIDPEAQRIALSIKQTTEAPQRPSGKGKPEEEPPEDREAVLPKHDGPLKGGVDRPSGGDQFGLNW